MCFQVPRVTLLGVNLKIGSSQLNCSFQSQLLSFNVKTVITHFFTILNECCININLFIKHILNCVYIVKEPNERNKSFFFKVFYNKKVTHHVFDRTKYETLKWNEK